jgi:serine protease AprX
MIALAIFATLFPVPHAASADLDAPAWIEQALDPASLLDALARHPQRLPADPLAHMDFATQSDGTLRVMVALKGRDRSIESRMTKLTRRLHWYGKGPRFLGSVDHDGFIALLRDPAVRFVEPDYPLTYFLARSVADVSGRGARGLWDLTDRDAPLGRLLSSVPDLPVDAVTGKGITVAVLDSGIDKTHRDFGGWDCEAAPYGACESRILRSVTSEQIAGLPDPGDPIPTTDFASGHGTHVAGIIAGNGYYSRRGDNNSNIYGGEGSVIGMAPQASLVSVKVGEALSASLSTWSLQWTLDHVDEFGIRVANNSWGCRDGCAYAANSVTSQIQRDLYKAGVVTIFSAGNSGGTGSGNELSGYSQSPYVLSVASYNDRDARLSSWSSRGTAGSELQDPSRWSPEGEGGGAPRRPDIAAPGASIYSAANLTGGAASWVPRLSPGGDTGVGPRIFGYTFMSGTSMAAPHVSGAAALLFSACPQVRPLHVMRALKVGADRNKVLKTDGDGIAEPFEVGYGALDVAASLRWLRDGPCTGRVSRLEGKVQDRDTKQPLLLARIDCGAEHRTQTDGFGRFALEDVPVGTYTCKASAKGYKAQKRGVSIESFRSSEIDFALQEKP